MRLEILADENVHTRIIEILRNNNFKVISVSEKHKGYSDKQILSLALKNKAILFTEDSDFGEWIFAHKAKSAGVIFLRYYFRDFEDIACDLVILLNQYKNKLMNKFVTITKDKIRIREI